jgi:hypothetical protein
VRARARVYVHLRELSPHTLWSRLLLDNNVCACVCVSVCLPVCLSVAGFMAMIIWVFAAYGFYVLEKDNKALDGLETKLN